MQQQLTISVSPAEAASSSAIHAQICRHLALSEDAVSGFNLLKRSIDARAKQPAVLLSLQVFINEPFHRRNIKKIHLRDVSHSPHSVIIAGAGPAGMFAALRLVEAGIRPVILERGKDVRARRRDLAALNKEGIVNPESNYCFGEGGAGTYSDGKLYTRSTKRGDVERILNAFVQFGADENILYDAHPHIGTNKLPHIITAMREELTACGAEFMFETRVTDLSIVNNKLTAVHTDRAVLDAEALILATGHSARDIFSLLHGRNIRIEAKPFALGVRVEHPQSLIDTIRYHQPSRGDFLPPASYSVVQQVSGRGVFSFCMCPGGIIAPAATSPGELVVNGWSPSKQNNPFANSGMVVTVEEHDFHELTNVHGPLAAMEFQRSVERRCFEAGGGDLVAPAQRLEDFVRKNMSTSLPACSYVPGVRPAQLHELLPGFVYDSLQEAFRAFGKKMKGYFTNEALVVATESRTSSPVRIPRNPHTLQHPQIEGLYPCGEGAGYAGGIMSAAMDGEKVATAIKQHYDA